MDDSVVSMDDIGEIIVFDLVLIGQLLKVVNSVLYKFFNCIEIIIKVLQVIGICVVYDLVLVYGIFYVFCNVEVKIIDLDWFWEQSVSCGLLVKYIVE